MSARRFGELLEARGDGCPRSLILASTINHHSFSSGNTFTSTRRIRRGEVVDVPFSFSGTNDAGTASAPGRDHHHALGSAAAALAGGDAR